MFKYSLFFLNLQIDYLLKFYVDRELRDDELEDLKYNSDDFENGIFRVSDNISVGFLPVEKEK